jgi:hypothetical protein
MMRDNTTRRDVLRKTGLAIAGTTALSGTALAGDVDPRPEPVAGSVPNWNVPATKLMPWGHRDTVGTGEWAVHDFGWVFEPELDEGGREYARQWVEDTTDVITIDGEVFEDDDFRWSEPEEAEEEDNGGTHIHWQYATPPKEPGEYWFEWECYRNGELVYDFFPLGQYITVEEGHHHDDGHDH